MAGLQDLGAKLRGCLPNSWRLLKTRSVHEIPNRASPWPEVVVHAMAGHAIKQEESAFALSLLIGFYCMLRTGELLGLLNRHIAMYQPGQVAVVSLGRIDKSRQKTGSWELWMSLDSYGNGRKTHHQRLLCAHLPINGIRRLLSNWILSYSLRRGGATHGFRHHGSFDKLLAQGRWAAPKTAKVYINEGLAILAEIKVPIQSLKSFLTCYRAACG